MRPRRLLARVAVLFLLPASAQAQNPVSIGLKALPLKAPDYELIEFVSEGEAYGPVSQEVRGRFHRLVVLRSVIAYERPVLRVETLTYGDEGCCTRLIGVRELPIELLRTHGIALPEATTSEFKLVRWLGPRAVEFRYGGLVCKLGALGKPQSTVACRQ